jgi:NAD(P)-dependent dehydrogenase (short-subunit alcohol dehydrogenase family)
MIAALDMTGRVCLVTGATDGHGRAVAAQLALRGADVVLLGRNPDKCRRVQAEITAEIVASGNGGKSPEILICDLSKRAEIDRAAGEFLASGRPLHVLVNNAGLVTLRREESADGHELGFAVNYLALFQLTMRLLPRLLENPPARIINVSSDTYKIARLDLDDLALDPYSAAKSYGRSKLAIVYHTIELARRLEARGIQGLTVNAVDPGPVASNIGANNPGLLYTVVRPMIKYLFPSANRAARTAIMLATDPALATRSGGYYRSMKHRDNPLDFDPVLSERLWRISSELTGTDL